MRRFEGKVVVITGAARGQGRAHALAFAEEGADVVALDICSQIPSVPYEMATRADLEVTAESVTRAGARVLARACDVRSSRQLEQAMKEAAEELGPVEVLVANAGIFGLAPVWELTETAWADMIEVNLTGVWRSVKAVAPYMIDRRSGSIILTSSVNGLEGAVGFSHYVAAKHGVIGLMRSVALELGPYDIRCNAVLPGAVDTPMTDWQAMYDVMAGRPNGTPEDRLTSGRNWSALAGTALLPPSAVSRAILWLASDDAAEITGVCLPVDAGHLILPGRKG